MISILVGCLLLTSLLLIRNAQHSAILVTAFAFRILLSVFHLAGLTLPDSQFDARTFEQVAWLWARDRELFDDFTTGSYLYSWIGSGVYLAVGRVPFVLHALNSYFGTLTIYFVIRSAQQLSPGSRIDLSVGWILAFYPSVVLYSVLTMREAPMVCALSVSIYLLLRWMSTRRIRHGWGALLFAVISQLFHAGLFGVTVAVLLIYISGSLRAVTVRDNVRPVALFMIVAATVGMLQYSLRTGVGIEKLWGLLQAFNVDTLESLQSYSARGRGAYLSNVRIVTWVDLVWNTPLRIVFFLGTPFIWMVSQFRDFLGLLDALTLLYLASHISVSLIRRRRWPGKPKYLAVALIVICIVTVFSIATSNYGTAFRHRAKVFPWFLLLYLYGRDLPSITRGRRRRSVRLSLVDSQVISQQRQYPSPPAPRATLKG